jgi:transaldolase
MKAKNYLEWLSGETRTVWWHDSGDPEELEQGRSWGARGVTTNPVLTYRALYGKLAYWHRKIGSVGDGLEAQAKAEQLMRCVVVSAANMFEPIFKESGGALGYVCAQIDPALAANREAMVSMAKRFSSWAPNISVKFPATAAGLDALEECVSGGICATSTVSFTVAQVLASAERYRRGRHRAEKARIKPAPCFAVIMIGRIDDYLRDVVQDRRADVSESDIRQAGLAIVKRSYKIFKVQSYEAKLLIAALRGAHHMVGVCGADVIMSIHPKIQKVLVSSDVPREENIDTPVSRETLRRLQTIPEFIKAYEPEAMHEQDFITFGVTQKTLSQFSAAGWALLEGLTFQR